MKVEDNHYKYRIETKDSNGSVIDFVDIDTVEPLRCAYDVQDELNLETNEHVKRVEEIILNADSTEFWYVDEDRSTDTHLVCYFEEVQLMANADHPMVDTDRSLFEYGKINANEYQDTNFICTHVMPNGVSRIYMSIDKDQLLYQVFTNETIKEYIAQNPITIWYAIRYPVSIPRSMSKGHLLTLDGQTDVSISTNGDCGLPLVKFNIGDKEYNMDNNPIHLSSTTEGAQIRNIVLEGNTPINFARGNGVNTTEATSDTRYDFAPFYDGQTTIQGTVEGGYVSAKLYGDTMVNIAKPYGETPLLTANNEVSLCDDLLGTNEEGIVLADGEITEGRIIGDSLVNMVHNYIYGEIQNGTATYDGEYVKITSATTDVGASVLVRFETSTLKASKTYYIKYLCGKGAKIQEQVMYSLIRDTQNSFNYGYGVHYSWDYENQIFTLTPTQDTNSITIYIKQPANTLVRVNNSAYITDDLNKAISYNSQSAYSGIGSVVNPTVYSVTENLFDLDYVFNQSNYKDCGAFYPSVKIQLKPNTSYYFERNTSGTTNEFKNTYIVITTLENPKSGGTWITHATAMDSPKTVTFTTGNSGIINFSVGGVLSDDGQQHLDSLRELHFSNAFLIEDSSTNKVYTPHKHTEATLPYTLNKLPNGVADYIDVVNKVHVQRVGVLSDLRNNFTGWYRHSLTTSEMFVAAGHASSFSIEYIGMVDKVFTPRHSTTEPYSIYITGDACVVTIPQSDLVEDSLDAFKNKLAEINPTILYKMKTPIYTPLTDEQIAQLPLSAYKDGYVNLSSDQLTPSFEFRMRASNRYQVDMLETGYYYLNAPVGNVKLGTANVDVQQMPCIVKVDNVGTGDSGYRLGIGGYTSFLSLDKSTVTLGYYYDASGELKASGRDCVYEEYIPISNGDSILINQLSETSANLYSVTVLLYDSNKNMIKRFGLNKDRIQKINANNVAYFRFSCIHNMNITEPTTKVAEVYINPITLAKLPSHRIPTSFTQGMKCTTDFGYWEGVMESKPSSFRTVNISDGWSIVETSTIEGVILNRIEISSMSLIVEDEVDIATGKFTKRVGKVVLDGSSDEGWSIANRDNFIKTVFFRTSLPSKSRENYVCISNRIPYVMGWSGDFERLWIDNRDTLVVHTDKAFSVDDFRKYLASNPIIVYYPLEVPEISYLSISLPQVKTVANTGLQFARINGYLNAQVKPSHLTYPVPSLVGNRTYTVVHNRKNITGSTKPIILDLGGTQVELNDASSKTLVKTPSSLKHNSLIFTGGESTVDHVMVLDGDWTNKPIDYFENMMGHDTDAIITIIGNGQINDVAEQYLW